MIKVRAGINIPPVDAKDLCSPAVRITARGSVWISSTVNNCKPQPLAFPIPFSFFFLGMHPVWGDDFELPEADDSEEILLDVVHKEKNVLANKKLTVGDIRELQRILQIFSPTH